MKQPHSAPGDTCVGFGPMVKMKSVTIFLVKIVQDQKMLTYLPVLCGNRSAECGVNTT